ncbi:unnamed protein product [Oreochromis niloticus]|nr:unnamed protein product [Mustela putorius furo]
MCTLTQRPQSSVTMERIWLGALYLSGWHISTCLSHQYHFVADAKNWTEAQTYCRQTYTDLATIQNAEELNEFIRSVLSAGYNNDVWIGLYSEIDWMWSNGYTGIGADYKSWMSGQPNFRDASQFCVLTEISGWDDYFCTLENQFICYNGTQMNPEFVLVNQIMNWFSAQKYCRKNYTDLATVISDSDNQKVQSLVQNGISAWIGLFRHTNFFWSDGSSFIYKNFDYGANSADSKVICGYAELGNSGKWKFQTCDAALPFVCYNDPPGLQMQIWKLKINLDPSLELNNLTVKEDLLEMLQNRLKEKGLSGIALKWREQSDGKVFHEEGKAI